MVKSVSLPFDNFFWKEDDAMVKIMTPSEKMTSGQIGKIQDLLGAGLRKAGLQSEPTQRVIEHQGDALVTKLVVVVREFVEMVSNLIIRCVKVDRSQKPQEAIKSTGRAQCVNDDVVASMPHGEGEDSEVVFFNIGRYISDDNLEKEYELRGLKPADPYSLAKVNKDDPAFADTKPNATHWKDSNGKWCYAAFRQWTDSGRRVDVRRSGADWYGHWWFAGVRK